MGDEMAGKPISHTHFLAQEEDIENTGEGDVVIKTENEELACHFHF